MDSAQNSKADGSSYCDPIAREPELHEWLTSTDEKWKAAHALTDAMVRRCVQTDGDPASSCAVLRSQPLPLLALLRLVPTRIVREGHCKHSDAQYVRVSCSGASTSASDVF
jgi:hypothetical protein